MKTPFFGFAFSIFMAASLAAEVPSEVRSQFESDLKSLVASTGSQQQFSDAQISQALAEMANQAIKQHPTAFEFSSEDLTAFKDGRCPFTDAKIQTTYATLKTLADGNPMPVLVEFYQKQFVGGSLSPQQKTIYCRLTLAIIDYTKKLTAK